MCSKENSCVGDKDKICFKNPYTTSNIFTHTLLGKIGLYFSSVLLICSHSMRN